MIDREERRKRITGRLKQRLEDGMVDEVRKLLDEGITREILIYYGLEYKYITLYLTGEMSYNEMVRELEIAIHQFAKRQMTWFRGMERKGTKINWIDGELPMEEKVEKVMELIKV
jgi:tRNA dimethylallyltransferase